MLELEEKMEWMDKIFATQKLLDIFFIGIGLSNNWDF